MKLQYKAVEKDSLNSFYVKRIHRPHIEGDWHFHKEFELIYFLQGQGMRIVGDHISYFQKGELVLVGEWLPHLWRNDVGTSGGADVDFIVVKFSKDFEGIDLFSLPELAEVRNLLKRSYQGILFSETTLPKVHPILLRLSQSNSTEKMINFLRVLQILSQEDAYQLLSSSDFALPTAASEENRLQKIINYITINYDRSIPLEEIAGVIFMTPPAFCRFFKNSTNKTFSHFLNEFRVNKACQLLINNEKSIKQICYEVGFRSLTNFNRTFKNFKAMTPSEYRSNYQIFRQ